nr:hypothetical protein [Tanacetum cinerariifolium]
DEHAICHGYLTEKEHQQLFLDEEAFRETFEEEAKAKQEREKAEKELEEFVKQEQAHDELFRLEFGDFGHGLHKVIHKPKPGKTIKRHNGPKLSPGQAGYGLEAVRRTKGFQMTLPQVSGIPLGKPKS